MLVQRSLDPFLFGSIFIYSVQSRGRMDQPQLLFDRSGAHKIKFSAQNLPFKAKTRSGTVEMVSPQMLMISC